MNLTSSLSLVLPLALSASLVAQADWTQVIPTSTVNPVGCASGAATSSASAFYIFGGRYGSPTVFPNNTHLSQELWSFDGSAWTNHFGTTNPTRMEFSALAYDSDRDKVVMFGGKTTSGNPNGTTWEWDSTNGWVKMTPTTTSPTARYWSAMVYDQVSDTCILFGGYTGTSYLQETWAWDGSDWTNLAPTTQPSQRGRHMMCWDSDRDVAVMFGGWNGGLTSRRTDTWEWDGTAWSKVTTATTVPYATGCVQAGMSYDELRKQVVLCGGYTGAERDKTFEFDGTDWTNRGSLWTDGRSGPYSGYVAATGKTYMFGGFNGSSPFTTNPTFPKMSNTTWEYQTPDVASFIENGSFPGCAGSAGLPAISASMLPWIGESLTVDVSPVPAAGATALFIGTVPGTIPLDPLGYTGCSLQIAAGIFETATLAGTSASLTLPIPYWVSLVGYTLYFQGVTYDGTLGLTGRGEAVFGRL